MTEIRSFLNEWTAALEVCAGLLRSNQVEAQTTLSPLHRQDAGDILDDLAHLLFPEQMPLAGTACPSPCDRVYRLGQVVSALAQLVHRALPHTCPCTGCGMRAAALNTAWTFMEQLPSIQSTLLGDAQAAWEGDPAAKSVTEIISTYPGFYAVMTYRLAHALQDLEVPLLPRMMTEWAHSRTGIDIHPGARIGSRFFIDHGTGVVIGETTDIGEGVTVYQGVTLGAVNFPRDQDGRMIRGQKRHPTIEDDVVVYAEATILGGSTVVGKGSEVGGNVWLTHSVPPYSKVRAPARTTTKSPSRARP